MLALEGRPPLAVIPILIETSTEHCRIPTQQRCTSDTQRPTGSARGTGAIRRGRPVTGWNARWNGWLANEMWSPRLFASPSLLTTAQYFPKGAPGSRPKKRLTGVSERRDSQPLTAADLVK